MPSLTGGGAEKVLIDLFRHLSPSKYKVSLLLKDFDGIYVKCIPDYIEIIPLRHYSKTISSVLLRMKALRNFFWERDAHKAIRNRKFDAIISFCEGSSIIYHFFLTENAVRNISWVHINLHINHWCSFIFGANAIEKERRIYNMMDSIVFVSDGARQAFSDMFDISDRLHTIYNVIDRALIIKLSEEFYVEKTRFTICNIGRLDYQKRQDRLIEVAAELKKRGHDFEVWILGIGKWENKLKELAKDLEVEDRVKFLGFQTNPYPYLKASDLFMMTSDTEGYPTVVCESLCLGKPIISTSITGAEELLRDGIGVLTSFEINDIANKAEELMTNPDKLNSYAYASIAKSKEFNPAAIIRKIDDII